MGVTEVSIEKDILKCADLSQAHATRLKAESDLTAASQAETASLEEFADTLKKYGEQGASPEQIATAIEECNFTNDHKRILNEKILKTAQFGQVKVVGPTEHADIRKGADPHKAIDFEIEVAGREQPIRLSLYLNSNNKTRQTQSNDATHSGGTLADHEDAKTLIKELMNQAREKGIDLSKGVDSFKEKISKEFNDNVGELFYMLRIGVLRTASGALDIVDNGQLCERGYDGDGDPISWSLVSRGSSESK